MKYPVVYNQIKLLIKMWEKSKDENKEMMLKTLRQSIKEIEEDLKNE